MRDTRPFSRATMRSICCFLRRIFCRASIISCLIAATRLLTFLRAASVAVFLLLDLLQLLAQPAHLLDRLAHPLDVPALIELGVILVGVLDHLLDPNLLLAQLVAQVQGLLDGDSWN